jgi:hypothetical protein
MVVLFAYRDIFYHREIVNLAQLTILIVILVDLLLVYLVKMVFIITHKRKNVKHVKILIV